MQNYPLIIIKYAPYLFCISLTTILILNIIMIAIIVQTKQTMTKEPHHDKTCFRSF